MKLLAKCMTALLLMFATPVLAQTYPTRPVTVVVPFPPGGLGDLTARRLSQPVSTALGQQIIVEYKPGGGGSVGATYVKSAEPDGYTTFIANSAIMAINPYLMAKVGYDPIKDFAPISMLVSSPHILVVPGSSPVKSLAELLALAKTKNGGLTFASPGIGGGGHLLGEMLKQQTGTNLVHVPYKGAAPATQDVLGGRIDLFFDSIAIAAPHVASGGYRALAVTARTRLPSHPDVPTMAELGYPDINADTWFALFAPAGLPKDIQTRLSTAFTDALRNPELAKSFSEQGLDAQPSTPDELSMLLMKDSARYKTLISAIDIKVEQ